MKDTLIPLVMIVFIIIFALCVHGCFVHCDKIEYNNGICQECGGHLEYEQAVGHQYYTTYMYKCEKCGKRIELYYSPD